MCEFQFNMTDKKGTVPKLLHGTFTWYMYGTRDIYWMVIAKCKTKSKMTSGIQEYGQPPKIIKYCNKIISIQ